MSTLEPEPTRESIEQEIDALMKRVSKLTGALRAFRANTAAPPWDAYYCGNRAWRELDAARTHFNRYLKSSK